MTLLRFSVRGIAGAKVRFAMTTLAVVIGVALTVGVLIATDGLRASFNDLAERLHENVDLSVRSQSEAGDLMEDLPLLDPSVKEQLEAIDGVERTSGAVFEFGTVAINADGNALDPGFGRQIGRGWPEDESLATFSVLDDGVSRRPAGPDEFAMDHHTAADHGFQIGERYQVSTPSGTHSFELVGYYYFLEPDYRIALQGVAWDTDVARQLLHGGGGFDRIDVGLSPGASLPAVTASIERTLGPSIEVVSQQQQTNERGEEFRDVLDLFRNLLLAFAVIVLVISAFITYNTFLVVMDQRVRELGLLRVLGAGRLQVAQTVAVEALVVGVVATVVGFGLGVVVSRAIVGALGIAGAQMPPTDVIIDGGTILAALVVGIGVTLIAAIWPAVRARRVTPMAALADGADIDPYDRGRSIVMGSVFGGAGLVLLVVGLLSDPPTFLLVVLLGVGTLLVLLGVNIASPAMARPISLFLGWPAARKFAISGRLARLNAARNSRRTATTAAALMIGLSMVSLVTVLGTSFKQTLYDQLEDSVQAEWMMCVGECGSGESEFSSEATRKMAALPELESVEAFRFRNGGVRTTDGEQHVLTAASLASFSRHVEPDIVSGSLARAGPGDVMVHVDDADELALAVGDQVRLQFPGRREASFNVVALFAEDSVLSSWVIDLQDWDRYIVGDQDSLATAVTTTGVSLQEARAALEAALTDYPQLDVRNRAQYRESRITQVDTLLAVINVFLVIALLIAVLGISNTMALSVFERTRELGLLRAVGMDRWQIWSAIVLEGVIVAVFGGLVGIATGVVAGLVAAVAIPGYIISALAVPWATLAIYLLVSAAAGLMAAVFPARRANRLDVLEAIHRQ
ncbi:ABC transporter permease [Candidatus Poriferisodalis sp.]|uniref:ABC transporter permease n=1 Tax=Candidatus Poriferisodalis sp. TaxID=3101277 RepID=UPI003C6EE118